MAEAFINPQLAPSATTLTELYAVPASTKTLVTGIVVCNRGNTDTTFRITVAPLGAADTDAHYQVKDRTVPANDSFLWDGPKPTLKATDKVRVYAGNGNLSFTLYGVESPA